MAQPPKPAFVLADVHSSSYTTALAVTSVREVTGMSVKLDNEDDQNEPVLVCGTNDGSIGLWSLTTYRLLRHYSAEELATLFQLNDDPIRVTSVHPIPGCHRLLIQLKSNDIYLLETSGESLRHPISLLEEPWTAFPTSFAQVTPVLSDGNGLEHCFAYLADDTVKSSADVIQLVDGKRVLPIGSIRLVSKEAEEEKGHGIVMAIHLFTKDDTEKKQSLYLILAHEDGFIVLYRAELKERLENLLLEKKKIKKPTFEAAQISTLKSHSEMITCIAFHEGTMRGIACSVDNEIALWDVVIPTEGEEDPKITGLVERKSRRIQLTNAGILCCAIRADGRLFATGGKDGRLRLFALKSGKPLAVLVYHANTIEAVRFFLKSGNSNSKEEEASDHLLIAASRDKSVSVWSGLYPLKE